MQQIGLTSFCCLLQCLLAGWLQAEEQATENRRTASTLHYEANIVPNAELFKLDGQEWHFQTKDGIEIATAHPIRWGVWPGVIDHQAVWLTDGSWIACEVLEVRADSLKVHHRWLDLSEIPLTRVRAILFHPAASLAEWLDILGQLESLEGTSDTIWLHDGRRVSGIVQWPASQSGTPSPALQILVANELVDLSWADVRLLAVSPALVGPIAEVRGSTLVGLSDGSLLNVTRLAAYNDRLEIDITSLATLRTLDPTQKFIESIRTISSHRIPNVVRLDSLEPASYKFLPDSELIFPLGVNNTVFDAPIVIGRRNKAGIIQHALAMHSSSQATYRWDGSPGRLVAEVRLAEPTHEASKLGSCLGKVLLAKGGTLTTAMEFSLDRSTEHASQQMVDIDITDAQLVVLIVEKSTLGQWGDQVYWCDARFVSPSSP